MLGTSVSFFFLGGEVFQGFVEFAGEGCFVAMQGAHGGAAFVHFFDGLEGPRRERSVEQLGCRLALAVGQILLPDGCPEVPLFPPNRSSPPAPIVGSAGARPPRLTALKRASGSGLAC